MNIVIANIDVSLQGQWVSELHVYLVVSQIRQMDLDWLIDAELEEIVADSRRFPSPPFSLSPTDSNVFKWLVSVSVVCETIIE